MKQILNKFKVFFIVLVFTACDMEKDLVNPNEISVDGADVNLIMNAVQLDFADFFHAASDRVDHLVRMRAMTAGFRYQTANPPQSANNLWFLAYARVLVNSEVLIKLAEERGLTTHVAAAKAMQAYVYLTLVDIFGDVPQSEAIKASEGNFNPKVDASADIYAYAISLLGEARTELAKEGVDAGPALNRDIYYGGDRAKWTAFVNTIELKAWVNLSMIPARQAEANTRIDQLLALNLIDTEEEGFTYKYGTATVPVSRHPVYRQYYDPIEGQAGGYISNYFLNELFNGNGTEDPRWRYYFYRQVGSITKALDVDPKALGCQPGAIPDHYAAASAVFCVFEPGFYGRDHGDGSGLPPDGPVITCAGVYPAGGKIDNTLTSNANFFQPTIQGDGADGAGIQPIWMANYTDYLKAEIQARRGNAGPARAALVTAVENSIAQVRNFATSRGQVLTPGREPSTVDYLAAVTTNFDNAANKLDVVGREFYVALWGNGVEAYNIYRRSSAPRNMQPTRQLNPGVFLRSYVYPSDFVNLNSSVNQKDVNAVNRVFWDTNPDVLE